MKLFILIFVLSFQLPKWKYIVFYSTKIEHSGALMYDSKGKPINRFKQVGERKYFTNSKAAHAYFNEGVRKRDGKIYFFGTVVTKVWIDSVKIK